MIEHLAEPASEQQEAEQEYAVARVLAEQAASGAVNASIPHFHPLKRHETFSDGLSLEVL